jgi:hypothetical protein
LLDLYGLVHQCFHSSFYSDLIFTHITHTFSSWCCSCYFLLLPGCFFTIGTWSEHGQTTGGFYKCNRYDGSDVNSQVTAAQKAKAELDRYLHYYQRFHGHDQGLKFAAKQREAAEQKMIEQQQSKGSSWLDVQFLYQAAEQVIDCRRVLKYTYVLGNRTRLLIGMSFVSFSSLFLGFFLTENSPEKKLFEYQQEMLEKNVERLHEYTEKPISQIDRTQVVNLTRVTEKFLSSLLQNMTGGIVRLDEASLQLAAVGDTVGGTSSSSSSSASSSISTTPPSAKASGGRKRAGK